MFKKVSLETWLDFNNQEFVGSEYLPRTDEINYKKIAKPERSTSDSAGYDFRLPFDINIPADTPVVIPTGILADLDHLFDATEKRREEELEEIKKKYPEMLESNGDYDYREIKIEDIGGVPPVFLALYPRSSLGFKYGFRLLNSTGIIDADYAYNESNEGHIMVGCITSKPLALEQGSKICQGIIQPYFVMEDDDATGNRTGGMGSTGK